MLLNILTGFLHHCEKGYWEHHQEKIKEVEDRYNCNSCERDCDFKK